MRLRTAALAVLILAASGRAVHAHDFVEAGFWNGVLHPLLVPAHALTLLAFGLMTGQQDNAGRLFLLILFPAVLIAAILMIVSAVFPLDIVPTMLLACGAAAGLITALAKPLPRVIPATILAAGGLTLMFDSVPSVVSKRDTILALTGTALAATFTLAIVAYAVAALARDWQRIGVRIVGSWTAASALLVLALQLTK
jgi:urease accessory protein